MQNPFVYGKIVSGSFFTDREDDIINLESTFTSGINSIIISPRRWGKSSLVKKAAEKTMSANRNIKVVNIDMFNVRTEEEFYKELSETIIRSVSNKIDDWINISKKFFKSFIPKITFSADPAQEISLGLNWAEVKENPDDILDLAENIACSKKIKIVVCIDEFQNIAFFKNHMELQKKLRSHWQQHQNVSYCLYGSKRHMLMEVFSSPSMPFYKFGELIFLQKIDNIHWSKFIVSRFKKTGKKIPRKQASIIAASVENHPYYVQQLAQLCWFRTEVDYNENTTAIALDSLAMQLSLLFQNITENLSTTQINFLKAVLEKVTQFSSKTNIEHYKLGTSANVNRIMKALINKEIIDVFTPGKIEIMDPVYSYWLKNYYFKIGTFFLPES